MVNVARKLPVLDFKHFTCGTPEEQKEFVRNLGDALRDVGFFSLINHDVDTEMIRRLYAEMDRVFTLPEESKLKYDGAATAGSVGFTRFGTEHAKGCEAPDLKEFWHVMREGHPVYKNIWPDDEVPGFRAIAQEIYGQLDLCAMALLEACALYLGESERLFREMADGGNTVLRLLHYPPIAEDADPVSVRAAAHEDINLITLLCESTASGLEILERDGSWTPVESVPGQIIVDSGDMIQQITNGYLRATTHRVVNPNDSRSRRYSIPFFVHPRGEVRLDPLPSCIRLTGGEAKFPPMTAQEYLDRRLQEIGLS